MVINHYNYWPYTPPRLGDIGDIRIEVENHIISSFGVPREILRGDVVDAVVRSHGPLKCFSANTRQGLPP